MKVRRVGQDEDIRAVRSLHDEVVVSLEMAIFIIDRVLKQVALSKVVEQSQQLASEAQDLAALPDDADADEIWPVSTSCNVC